MSAFNIYGSESRFPVLALSFAYSLLALHKSGDFMRYIPAIETKQNKSLRNCVKVNNSGRSL
jgi:hypothetical protein